MVEEVEIMGKYEMIDSWNFEWEKVRKNWRLEKNKEKLNGSLFC